MYTIDISYFLVYSAKMVDTCDCTIESRVLAASFYMVSDQIRYVMKLVRDRMSAKYDSELPNK